MSNQVGLVYRDGVLGRITLYDTIRVQVNDLRTGDPFVSVSCSDGTTDVSCYLSPALAVDLTQQLVKCFPEVVAAPCPAILGTQLAAG